ncbi:MULTISPECIES: S8 family peptidase [unclassified Haladaptatus]|uniref:S8 family peptidase n=1 Tax=unclassified Haladaptatus TaxID=2622732 RepID=UPI00209C09E7|nr:MULTISPECIES: S8 family peptidase [unclassified Haladaptatus]MCO8245015.1 S8 family peptidase [Haladaptatus sp. AB643]MCO8253157.1 S8 family peptidase [Haladaptatus sp. AB618]
MADDNISRFDRRTFLKATGAAGAAAAMSGVTMATPGREPGPKEDEILVGVSAGHGDIEQAVTAKSPMDITVVHKNEHLRYVAVKLPSAMPDSARQSFIDAIEKREGIKYAEQNATHSTYLTPDDPKFGQQYAPQMVNSDDAWDTTLGSHDVTIAVVDTGAQYDHPDLQANYKSNPGKDFADDDSDPYPDAPQDEYHATHVSGIAAGVIDNGTGVAGQGNSSLINGRALDEGGSGSTSDIADAIRWAADQGADVINMSLGGGGYTSTMKNAVTYASNNGVFIACAAGNDGSSSVSYPAGYSECLAVSAIDSNGDLASFSQYGSKVELCAPGVDVLSTTTETRGSYEKLSGTSMATPVVSGVAGLTLAQWDLTNSELRSHLKNTAVDVGLSSDKQGSGRVDAYNAVTTDPGSGSGGGGGGGSDSTSGSASGSLSGYSDYADYTWSWNYSSPSQVVVELDGPSDADFDLYVNTGTSSAASPSSYDYSSTSTGSQETITIDSPDTSTDMQIDVDSYSGSGSYTVTITEYQ